MDTSKRCGCGKVYASQHAFRALPLPSSGRGEANVGGFLMLFRNCTCQSTLAWVLADLEAA